VDKKISPQVWPQGDIISKAKGGDNAVSRFIGKVHVSSSILSGLYGETLLSRLPKQKSPVISLLSKSISLPGIGEISTE